MNQTHNGFLNCKCTTPFKLCFNISGCNYIQSQKLNIVLTLSNKHVSAGALDGWIKNLRLAVSYFFYHYLNDLGIFVDVAP